MGPLFFASNEARGPAIRRDRVRDLRLTWEWDCPIIIKNINI